MIHPVNSRKWVILLVALMVSSCSYFDDEPEEILEGQRFPVIGLGRAVAVDPEAAATPVQLPQARSILNWTQSGGNASHTPGHLAVSDSLSIAWSSSAGVGSSTRQKLVSPPIVADGKIFVKDANGGVRAMDKTSGRTIWQTNLTPEGESSGEGFGGGLAYDGGRLYVTSPYGYMIALNPASGDELWRQKVRVPFRAPPAAANGRVFAITQDNQLFAFDGATGTVTWTYRAIAETTVLMQRAAPALQGDVIVAPFSSGEVVALRASNGAVLWADQLGRTGVVTPLAAISDVAAAPVIDRGRVYVVSHGGRAAAFDLRSGRRIWLRDAGGVQMPWAVGDTLFLVGLEGELIAMRKADGRIRWVNALDRYSDPDGRSGLIAWSGPLLISNRLIAVSSDGRLVSFDPVTGAEISTQEVPDSFMSPIVSEGTVYILGDNAELVALR